MFSIRHAVRVVQSTLREAQKRKTRSPQWAHVEKTFLATHTTCAACGYVKRLQVHHKKPFHLHPEDELNPDNLIALCMGPNECHLRIGHGDNFKAYNPNVVADAALALTAPGQRTAIEARAKATRLMA